MKTVSWPSTAERHFSAILIHINGLLSTEKYYCSTCLYPYLAKVYTVSRHWDTYERIELALVEK
jgi:hypothetical protein